MHLKLRPSPGQVWIVLCGLTLAGVWLASGRATLDAGAQGVGLLILLLALVKVWLILQYYMELRAMPRAWQWSFRLWLAMLMIGLSGMYWFAGAWQ